MLIIINYIYNNYLKYVSTHSSMDNIVIKHHYTNINNVFT